MDRRTFMVAASGNVGIAYLTLCGCSSRGSRAEALMPGRGGAPALHGAGEEHLIFDHNSVEYRLDPHGHRFHDLDVAGRAGAVGELGDGAGELNYPVGAVVGPGGLLYVLERGNSRVQVFDQNHRRVAAIGSHGGGAGQLNHPSDLTFGPDGNLYVADTFNHRVQVFDRKGNALRSIGKFGRQKGKLNAPRSVAVSRDGLVHVVDGGSSRIQVFSAGGESAFQYGEYGTGPGEMLMPSSIVIDSQNRVSIGDIATGFVNVFDARGEFVGHIEPKDENGRAVAPVQLQVAPGDKLYVWTAGHQAFVPR